MTIIKQEDLIQSVADSLQYISYYHSPDFVQAMHQAWLREESESAKNAISQILINSRMSAEGRRPICQDTGIVVVFVKVGMNVHWQASLSLNEMINEGVRQAYLNPDNPLRASIVSPPAGKRTNTADNTPAVIHVEIVPGDSVELTVSAKGGGSENKSKFTILNPSDSVVDWVLETVPKMGAGWCPPGVLGIGVGGSAEKAMLMAKESLMEPIDIHQLIEQGPRTEAEELRLELFERVNNLGIGAQGLGGVTTVLDVKVNEYPTHAASLPIAMIPNCAATRHVHVVLDGSGPAELSQPKLSDWPEISWEPGSDTLKVNLEEVDQKSIEQWKPGQTLLLSGKILTGRDAAHKRIAEYYERGEELPNGVDFHNRFIYYVGPVDAVGQEAVGPAGPTTATRMDKFTDMMLEQAGLLGMIGKAERGEKTIQSIRSHRSVYLIAVGGAAYLVSKAIKSARVVAFEDLGMEAIYEFEVDEMPVTVAVDSKGESVHQTGPEIWRNKLRVKVEEPAL
ncbi:MAG: fumarate hydratase [bacterium]